MRGQGKDKQPEKINTSHVLYQPLRYNKNRPTRQTKAAKVRKMKDIMNLFNVYLQFLIRTFGFKWANQNSCTLF